MAINKHRIPDGNGGHDCYYWRCDTDAEKPSSGLSAGDLVFAVDTGKIYKATGPTTLSELASSQGSEAFPVGSIFFSAVSTNPATLLGYGTWLAFGAGRVPVGLDAADPDFDSEELVGGEKTHTLVVSEMPVHTHTQNSHNHTQDAHSHAQRRNNTATGANSGWTTAFDTSSSNPVNDSNTATASVVATNQAATAVNQNTGGDGAHNNLQPFIVVRMWKRTA